RQCGNTLAESGTSGILNENAATPRSRNNFLHQIEPAFRAMRAAPCTDAHVVLRPTRSLLVNSPCRKRPCRGWPIANRQSKLLPAYRADQTADCLPANRNERWSGARPPSARVSMENARLLSDPVANAQAPTSVCNAAQTRANGLENASTIAKC